VLLAILLAIALVTSRSALKSGLAEIDQAKAAITTARLESQPVAALAQAEKHLAVAQRDFETADVRLTPFSPLLDRLSWVPRVGQQIAAASPAARVAHRSTQAALLLIRGLHPLTTRFSTLGHTRKGIGISSAVADLAKGRGDFLLACGDIADARDARTRLRGLSDPAITGPLRSIDRDLPRLQILCGSMAALPQLLGFHEPYRYMLAYQDPLQLRATGGFLGTAALLTLRDGRVSQDFRSTWIQDNLSFQPPEPMFMYNREPGWLFRDSNWSPDFPTTAGLERFFAKLDLGWQAPATINLTPKVVADTLTAVGSFYSPEYHRLISGQNVTQLTDYYTHHAKAYFGPLAIADAATRRKQFIQIVAAHIFQRLRMVHLSELIRLANRLATDVTSGDVLMNFTDPAKQDLLATAGATGAVRREGGDYLFVVDSNLSYNKINPYVHINLEYAAHILRDRWVQSDLTLRFRNMQGPASAYDEAYGPGAGSAGGPADYSDFVRIYVPAGAEISNQSGWTQPWSPGPAYGRTMFSGYLIVPVGQTRTVRLRYLIPPNLFSWSNGRRYRLTVQHQPGNLIDRVAVRAYDGARLVAEGVAVQSTTDWSVSGSVAHLPFHQLTLLAAPPPVVAPGQWIEPHAFLGKATS
jgi:hypothetical protein